MDIRPEEARQKGPALATNEGLCFSPGAICVGRGKPVSERRVGLWADLRPLIMAAVVVVDEPLVTRMVNYGVVQRRIPSFRPRRAAPSRLAEPHQARKQRSDPQGPNTRSRQKSGASVSQFRRHVLIKLLPGLGNSIDPECERTRFKRLGNR